MAAVFIADNAVRRVVIHFVQQFAGEFLCLPRLSGIAVEVCEIVAGLIAVGVLAFEAGNVGDIQREFVGFESEQVVQCLDELFPAAEELDETVHVMRSEESVVPWSGFGIVPAGGENVERRGAAAVAVPAPEEGCRAVEHVHIVRRPAVIFFRNVFMSKFFRHSGNAPVIVCVFQCQ